MYQAGFGSVDAAAAIAGEMAMLAMKDADTGYKPRRLWRALAWSAFSRDMVEQQRYGRYRANARGLEFQHDLQSYSYLFKNAIMRATANDVSTMSPILRDRCRVLRFPEPGSEHLPQLAIRIMERLYVERGQSPRWATELEGFELDAAASVWGGGSIRKLERIVEQLVEARERERPLQ